MELPGSKCVKVSYFTHETFIIIIIPSIILSIVLVSFEMWIVLIIIIMIAVAAAAAPQLPAEFFASRAEFDKSQNNGHQPKRVVIFSYAKALLLELMNDA